MASNHFGEIFRMTTFGESHGPAIGVVIDGCPAGLEISEEEINQELAKRRPGQNSYTSPRKEKDLAEILSGVFEGKTTGAPIAILIRNVDADSSQYAAVKDLYRPGHANFTYLKKYGIFDYRGGGRASARETAARVAAGAVAKKLIKIFNMECFANVENEAELIEKIQEVQAEGDSIGGVVACEAKVNSGLGDPVYRKLEALLASAMLSLPATKGFEIGSGFQAALMRGSEYNDPFEIENDEIITKASTLGGISTGSTLKFRVAFKPTSSIKIAQKTVSLKGEITTLELPQTARHDPCVAIRAAPVVEAMTALVLADLALMNRSARL